MRRDDQNIDAFGKQVIALLCLHGVVAIGDLNFTFGADLFAAPFDQRLVTLGRIEGGLSAPEQSREDIADLLDFYAARHAADGQDPIRFGEDLLQALIDYAWPGNVRELSNLVDRFTTLFPGRCVALTEIPSAMLPPGLRAQLAGWLDDRIHSRHGIRGSVLTCALACALCAPMLAAFTAPDAATVPFSGVPAPAMVPYQAADPTWNGAPTLGDYAGMMMVEVHMLWGLGLAFRLQENTWNGTTAPQLVVRRIFDTPDSEYAEKFKHSIEPVLTVTKTSNVDNYDHIAVFEKTLCRRRCDLVAL